MELHKAIKQIIDLKGHEIITNAQIINYLLDYQAFKEKPATKLILRDVINSGYAEEILSLDSNNASWQIAFMKYERDFIDSCGYKDYLVKYVFEAIAYGIGLQLGSNEPSITLGIDVDSFFDIPEDAQEPPSVDSENTNQKQNVNPSDLYSIALTFYNEGKFVQAKSFIEKSVSLFHNSYVPSIQLKLKGDINMNLGSFAEAIIDYNNCFARKATELGLEMDDLREQLKEHKIKGYENSIFCYYFCLYSIGKITEGQWLKIVKDEAMYGLNDAILYCVQHRINPMESHMDIYFIDKNMLKTGDFLYDDGTFAHELSSSKKVIAKVLLANTSDYEVSQGWKTGYLIPLREDGNAFISDYYMWSTENEDLPFPFSHYTFDDINHFNDVKTIESEHYISINNYNHFPAFKAAKDFPVKIPISGSSQWFIPSIHGFKRIGIAFNWRDNFVYWHGGDYWTSSQADSTNAIHVMTSNATGYVFRRAEKSAKKLILPIAAF